MSKNIIVFGIGNLSKVIYEYSLEMSDFNIEAFMVDDEYYNDEIFCSLPVLKSSMLNDELFVKSHSFLLCVGYKKMRNRKILFNKLLDKNCDLVNFIHPNSYICKTAIMGVNNIIFPGVVIENSVKIGDNNLFWSQTLIAHDVFMSSHNYIAAQVLIAGDSHIGNLCFFGNKSFLINSLNVADETYLVAGSGLFKNSLPSCMYWKNPAIMMGKHEENGIEIK